MNTSFLNVNNDRTYFDKLWNKAETTEKEQGGAAPVYWTSGGVKESSKDSKQADDTIKWLKLHNHLNTSDRLINVGYGAGFFMRNFAKECSYVTGLDMSEEMITSGACSCAACGCDNIDFIQADFTKVSARELGLYKKYDLALCALTPQVHGPEGLDKLMDYSRRDCFDSCQINCTDILADKIYKKLYNKKLQSSGSENIQAFYCLFNLLLLGGYLPVVDYYKADYKDYISAGHETAGEIALNFWPYDPAYAAAEEDKIYRYLCEHADENGRILRPLSRTYAWILWNVQKNTPVYN